MPSSRAKPRSTLVALRAICICGIALAGCTSIPKTPARFYALDGERIIKVDLYRLNEGHGQATGKLPDGRLLRGDYDLTAASSTPHDDQSTAAQSGAVALSWAEQYGYTDASDPHPRGSGTLSGDNGFSMRFVIYSIDTASGYGTGLGRDNTGTWYRIHVGEPD
jgi:hypothetical protein